jgi:hypothetical protein
MKRIFQAGRGKARGVVVASSVTVMVLPALFLAPFVLPAVVRGEDRDPLAEARAVLAQRRSEADQRRSAESQGSWTRLTNRTDSAFQRNRAEDSRPGQGQQASGPSPYNPKFGAPAFQMPGTPGQDTTSPKLKQFHPSEEPGTDTKGRKFLSRDRSEKEDTCPEDADRRDVEQGRKSTLSYTGESPSKDRLRAYDEIYQSKTPLAVPTFQMPAGPAAALAAPGAQTWGGRVLTQYRPETEAKGLEKARMQREQQAEQQEARKGEGSSGFRNLFDRTKRLESR